jgi:hypothetical protein
MGAKTIRKFFADVLLSDNPTSSKRLVTLLVTGHFLLASFLILFLAAYMVFYLPKGRLDPALLELLKEILEYDFYIILSGLGFIAVENVSTMIIERAKAKFGNILSQGGNSTIINTGSGDVSKTAQANEDVRDA